MAKRKNKWHDDKFKNLVAKKVAARMELACEFVEGDMRARAHGHYGEDLRAVDKGQYVGSFGHEVEINKLEIIGTIFNTAEHAMYVEFGTGQYAEDGSGRKDGWYFTDPDTGEKRFTMGMRPRPIMRTALYENKETINRIMGA